MMNVNKELFSIYLKLQLSNNSDYWNSVWHELNKLTGKSMDFTCPEYKEAVKQAKKIKNSILYKALEED